MVHLGIVLGLVWCLFLCCFRFVVLWLLIVLVGLSFRLCFWFCLIIVLHGPVGLFVCCLLCCCYGFDLVAGVFVSFRLPVVLLLVG